MKRTNTVNVGGRELMGLVAIGIVVVAITSVAGSRPATGVSNVNQTNHSDSQPVTTTGLAINGTTNAGDEEPTIAHNQSEATTMPPTRPVPRKSKDDDESISTTTASSKTAAWLIGLGTGIPLALAVTYLLFRLIVTQWPRYAVQEICLPDYEHKKDKEFDALMKKYGGGKGGQPPTTACAEKMPETRKRRKRTRQGEHKSAPSETQSEPPKSTKASINDNKSPTQSGASNGSPTDFNGVTLANLNVDEQGNYY